MAKTEIDKILQKIDWEFKQNRGCCIGEDDWYAIRSFIAKIQNSSHNSDYAKCAEAIMSLDLVDAVINKKGVLISILKQHFT